MPDELRHRKLAQANVESDVNPALIADEAVPLVGPLVDSYGRHIKNLRISVTDKCNFRCVYCMPAEGLPWLPRADILTFEEITRIAQVAVSLGIDQIRLTGGEPLVRRDIATLVAMLHSIPGLRSLSLTTNGVLLGKLARPLAEAGLTRINVSLDSLVREKFAQLTRRDALEQVLAGLEDVGKVSRRSGPSRSTRSPCADSPNPRYSISSHSPAVKPMSVRWIEFMPLDADQIWRKEDILTGAEIKRDHRGQTTVRSRQSQAMTPPRRRAATPSPTAWVRSASSIRSASHSAAGATAYA